MTSVLSDVAVLLPARLHNHAAERIRRTFRTIALEGSDLSALSTADKTAIRGMAGGVAIGAAMIDALPNLEIIANFGVGYDGIDARHAGSRGIMVTNTPDVLTEEVADTAIALLLNTVRELPRAEQWLRDGRWMREGNYPLSRLTLRGRKAGIFGMGRIGLAIAKRLEAFGLDIAYHNRRPVEGLAYAYHDTLEGLAQAVDTLISVAPGTPATEKAVNLSVLKALGPDGVFVNIGRGSTVDEPALAQALADGAIAAAGLDVFADEPNVPQALLDLPNVVLLPHIGSGSHHTRQAMADLCVDNLVSWFSEGRALTPVPETAHVRAAG